MLTLFIALASSTASLPAQAAPEQSKNPIICKSDPVGSEVGTHMRSRKVCMKKSDRDFIEREQKATVRDIINDGNDRERFIPSGQRGTSEGGRGGGDPNNFFGNSNPP